MALNAIMLWMFLSSSVVGSIMGGVRSSQQQAAIRRQVCNMANQMKEYRTSAMATENLLNAENIMLQKELVTIGGQINDTKTQILEQHKNFKTHYNLWVLAAFIFLSMLIFILATKKFYIGATTEK